MNVAPVIAVIAFAVAALGIILIVGALHVSGTIQGFDLPERVMHKIGISIGYALLFALLYTIPHSAPELILPNSSVVAVGACLETPDVAVVDVNETVVVEIVARLDESLCVVSPGAERRLIEVADIVHMELSGAGFNGQIVAIGADAKPLDGERQEARWKWAVKPDVPGGYTLTVVATALAADGQLYSEDIQSTVNVQARSTFGYHVSRAGRWLGEVVETTQVIVGGSAAIVAALGTFLLVRRRSGTREPTKNNGRRVRKPRIDRRRRPLHDRRKDTLSKRPSGRRTL